jgi:hypothetical protein
MKGKACNFLTEIKHCQVHVQCTYEINVRLKYTLLPAYITDWWQKFTSGSLDHTGGRPIFIFRLIYIFKDHNAYLENKVLQLYKPNNYYFWDDFDSFLCKCFSSHFWEIR